MTYSARTRGTNFYLNNFRQSNEKFLWEDLVIESIKMYGQDMYYLPKTLVNFDEVYGEDDQMKFDTAIPIEMYIKSVDGFGGEGVFYSKFGVEIRDQVTFTVSKRIFEQEVGIAASIVRPNEGDLIYFPLNQKLFVIRYVDYKPFFYQLGDLQTYDLVCELYEYSNEIIDTGIDVIDELQDKYSTNVLDWTLDTSDGYSLMTSDGNYLVHSQYMLDTASGGTQDSTSDNEEIDAEIIYKDIMNWSEIDPFSESGVY